MREKKKTSNVQRPTSNGGNEGNGGRKKKEPAIVRDLPASERRLWRSFHKAFLRELRQQDGLYSPSIGNKRLTKATYYGTIAHNLALLAVWGLEGNRNSKIENRKSKS